MIMWCVLSGGCVHTTWSSGMCYYKVHVSISHDHVRCVHTTSPSGMLCGVCAYHITIWYDIWCVCMCVHTTSPSGMCYYKVVCVSIPHDHVVCAKWWVCPYHMVI